MNKSNEETPLSDGHIRYKEYCVMCSCATNVDIFEHVEHREHYIDGAGQLCEECFKKINEK